MIELDNPDLGERYVIRTVPLSEAKVLRQQGVVFYDYTKLSAINTCPTWGVLRYALHRTEIPLSASGRNLAVECGSACHDFFAALRMWTLMDDAAFRKPNEKLFQQVKKHGYKLFSAERWDSMLTIPQDADRQTNALNFSLDALHTSGYYDDPSDRKRTMSNMEASCIAYLQRFLESDRPVAVKGDLIGVEIPFVLEVKRFKGTDTTTHYYCGRIDGVQRSSYGYTVEENKTAAQLSSAWATSFAISPQVTGYTIAGTCLFGEEITNATVMGVQIPLPRDVFNGVKFESLSRTVSDRVRWAEWFFHSIETYERYVATPHLAPRYGHSCNRFFSACQFIPFCASERDEQASILEAMRVDEWSPLDHLDKEGE